MWVKTTYPDQLDYWGAAPAGNQTRVSSVAGTYTITVLPAQQNVFVLGFEPRISRVLGERHNQARPYEQVAASNEGRTRDLALTKRMLCQLSYRGETQTGSPSVARTDPLARLAGTRL